MDELILKEINVEGNKVEYKYEICGKVASCFNEKENLVIEYPMSMCSVPKSILVIPFLGNVLPISWVTDTKIVIDAVDKDFFEHIKEIKKGYEQMFPDFHFSGELITGCIEKNVREDSGKVAMFFSGGVDATTTLIRHVQEKPDLITIWGSDVRRDDIEAWNIVYGHTLKRAEQFNLSAYYVKSNFTTFIDNCNLNKLVAESGDNWWHGFQHGLAIISCAAPLAYLYSYRKLYIASTYNEGLKGTYTCASDPIIDNNVHFCGCSTIHDSYELSRQDKVKLLVQKSKEYENVYLKVCFMLDSGGVNCCACEKCYRTILEIVSEGGDPNQFGFQWNKKKIMKCKVDMYSKIRISNHQIENYYLPIQKAFIENKDIIKNYSYYKWIIRMNFDNFNKFALKRIRKKLGSIRRKIFR